METAVRGSALVGLGWRRTMGLSWGSLRTERPAMAKKHLTEVGQLGQEGGRGGARHAAAAAPADDAARTFSSSTPTTA